jgi:hypothetical protein
VETSVSWDCWVCWRRSATKYDAKWQFIIVVYSYSLETTAFSQSAVLDHPLPSKQAHIRRFFPAFLHRIPQNAHQLVIHLVDIKIRKLILMFFLPDCIRMRGLMSPSKLFSRLSSSNFVQLSAKIVSIWDILLELKSNTARLLARNLRRGVNDVILLFHRKRDYN